MEGIVLIIFLLLVAWLVLPVILLLRSRSLERRISALERRLAATDLEHPDVEPAQEPASPAPPRPAPAWEGSPPVQAGPPSQAAAPAPADESIEPSLATSPAARPWIASPEPSPTPEGVGTRFGIPSSIDWEQFLGVKLFAWIGGLVLFLGVAFFVKYSFEHNLISPQIRLVAAYLLGVGLLIGGLALPRDRQAVTAQTLCATGVLILYANAFASHATYHFTGVPVTFGLMALVTTVAFLLAVRLEAQVVAVLGLLGGFLTPVLLSTGVDRPAALFSYIALLDIGLLAIALTKRWNHLGLLAAVATGIMQVGWVDRFFSAEKSLTAYAVFLGFAILFVAGLWLASRQGTVTRWDEGAALLMPTAALLFALYLLTHPYPAVAQRVGLLFGFVFLVDLAILAIAWLREHLRAAFLAAGGGVFVLLAVWTAQFLSADLLHPALGLFVLFAVLHAAVPVVLHRLRPAATPLWWIQCYPVLALLLTMVPFFKVAAPSLLVWPVILAIDLLGLAVVILTQSLILLLLLTVLTTLATASWILQAPPPPAQLPILLTLIAGFTLFLAGAALYAGRTIFTEPKRDPAASAGASPVPVLSRDQFADLAALAAIQPFLLLILVVLRLPAPNPSPIFGLAALLVLLFLGVSASFRVALLAPVTLASVLLLEYVWHVQWLTPSQAPLATAWHLGLAALIFLFPFVCRLREQAGTAVWAVSAVAMPAHFVLIYWALGQAYPGFPYLGLLPAALALPHLAAAGWLARTLPAAGPQRTAVLALFGGATLLFVTLIFPIQFEREWLTIAWALEGVALLWLFHRLPHPGLRAAGTAFLVVAFARLALNPAVLTYHPRADTPILNWFLYTYGIVAACQLAGARLLAPPRHRLGALNLPPILASLGTILAFLLLNIEIADYFSTGRTLTFRFSGNLAQDMTYSLAWALFAFGLLAIGFRIGQAPARYAGMGLLVATILKLFLHDLWRLGGLYRIGSLVGLAVVLIVVSFLYQRFLSASGPGRSR